MKLDFQLKQNIVKKIKKLMNSSLSIVVADFNKVCVKKIDELRRNGRKNKVDIFVAKNTLVSRVIEDSNYKFLKKIFVGPTIMAFSKKDPSLGARLFIDFSKKNLGFNIKGAGFDGKFISVDDIEFLSSIPTRSEAISKLILIILEISIRKLIRVILTILDKKRL